MAETVLSQEGPWTAASLSAAAWTAYEGGGGILPLMQRYRPYICPFELMLGQVPAGSRVLDIGCGGGLFLMLLSMSGRLDAAEGASVGFDVSHAAIGKAVQAAEKMGVTNAAFRQLDVIAPWPEGPFDVASIVDVLHHVPPAAQRSVIEQAAAAVGPGGVVVYKDMCKKPMWRACANRMHDLVMARDWIRYVPIGRVAGWFDELGMRVIERGATGRYWYGHEWIVAQKPET
ncbi:MAG: class I SAM-dependent methyltransferase [Planctomycetota bacterium]